MAYEDFVELADIEALVPHLKARGISLVALGLEPSADGGFLAAYRKAGGDPDKLPLPWRIKREGFLRRHLAQAKANGEAWWEDRPESADDPESASWDALTRRKRPLPLDVVGDRPSRRHGALIAWAYTPTPKSWNRWIYHVRGV